MLVLIAMPSCDSRTWMKAKPCFSPQAWDKGDRIHLEDNITQQLTQVCTPTSLHKTMHMNEIFHLHVDVCGAYICVCNTKWDLRITEPIMQNLRDCEMTVIIFLWLSMWLPVFSLSVFLLPKCISFSLWYYYNITALFSFRQTLWLNSFAGSCDNLKTGIILCCKIVFAKRQVTVVGNTTVTKHYVIARWQISWVSCSLVCT